MFRSRYPLPPGSGLLGRTCRSLKPTRPPLVNPSEGPSSPELRALDVSATTSVRCHNVALDPRNASSLKCHPGFVPGRATQMLLFVGRGRLVSEPGLASSCR